MSQAEVLVLELVAVDRLASGAVVVGEVASLIIFYRNFFLKIFHNFFLNFFFQNFSLFFSTQKFSVIYLAHEVRDDAMEGGALVAEALLSSAESAEVLSSPGDNIRSELHNDATSGPTTNVHVKVTAWEGHSFLKISTILKIVRIE